MPLHTRNVLGHHGFQWSASTSHLASGQIWHKQVPSPAVTLTQFPGQIHQHAPARWQTVTCQAGCDQAAALAADESSYIEVMRMQLSLHPLLCSVLNVAGRSSSV